MQQLISINQFKSQADFMEYMNLASKMESYHNGQKHTDILKDKVLAFLFYEPSTRTNLSFETAALRLGASKISVVGIENSSIKKGETLEDTIRVVDSYADGIVMRHPMTNAAKIATSISKKPFFNGGDGSGEHPTQCLLDLYTIYKNLGRLDNLKVSIVGDLKYGRTTHSLLKALSILNAEVTLISPDTLKMPESVLKSLQNDIQINYSENLEDSYDSDVVYMTRVQKERFEKAAEYEVIKNEYIIDKLFMDNFNPNGLLLHPLPRIHEITTEVDSDPRAVYFEQAANGVPIRMALIAKAFGVDKEL